MSYSLLENKPHRLKPRYVPDLDGLLSQCELNYWLIIKLIPELTCAPKLPENQPLQKQQWQRKTDSVHLMFEITDVARYTTTLNLTVQTPKVELKRSGGLIVRLYHDAQMAEVMEGSGPAALRAIYERSTSGQTIDEKRQANLFVGECLRACFLLIQSQSTDSPN